MFCFVDNTMITKQICIAQKLETIFILPFFPRHMKIRFNRRISVDYGRRNSVHHEHIWVVLQSAEK